MIVADSNLLAYLLIPGGRTHLSEEVLGRDSEWVVPLLWRSEFRNILTLYMRRHGMSLDQAKRTMRQAETLLQGREYLVASEPVLDLTAKSRLSAYEAEFVLLAEQLATRLVTGDSRLLEEAPDRARSPEAFLRE